MALVTDKKIVGGKGTVELEVCYFVNTKNYIGFINNEDWNINDSVEIIYLQSNPNVVRSYAFINTEYTWFKK